MTITEFSTGTFHHADTFEAMANLSNNSVDMLLVDLPYGTTQNKWDIVLPFDKLWDCYNRVCKTDAAMVFTAAQPFTTQLINSNPSNFKFTMVWDKVGTVGFQLAKRQPLRRHEDIVLFYRRQPVYNPQMEVRGKPRAKGGSQTDNGNYGKLRSSRSYNNTYYPTSILQVSNASKRGRLHSTQKPVLLFEHLINTYTNPGDTVLDNTAGSATTAIAAINTRRRWVCIENSDEYTPIALERIRDHPVPARQRTRT